MGQKLARKITVKTVYGAVFDVIYKAKPEGEKIGPVVPLMTVIGIASRVSVGTTDKGPFVKLHGTFKATNLKTGEVFSAPVAILPGNFADMVAAALDQAGTTGAQFAIQIGGHYDETAVTKYVYDIETLLPPSDTDPLSALEGKLKALAAPKPDADHAPAASTAAETNGKHADTHKRK